MHPKSTQAAQRWPCRSRQIVRYAAALLLAGLAAGALAFVLLPTQSQADNPVVRENRRPGTTAWQSANFSQYGSSLAKLEKAEEAYERSKADTGGDPAPTAAWSSGAVIEGYMGRTSINKGEAITLHVSTTAARYDVNVYRQGWYGGSGGSLKYSASNLIGASYPVPAPDANGMVSANWPAARTIQTDSSWTSGVYLVWLSAIDVTSPIGYALFVVRDDAQQADILYPVPTSTYQAYNAWGGKSLYDYNSTAGEPTRSRTIGHTTTTTAWASTYPATTT